MMHAVQELRAQQQMTLTPRLQQSLKVLQMSTQELSQEIARALNDNPFLEEPDEQEEDREELLAATPPTKQADSNDPTQPEAAGKATESEAAHSSELDSDSPALHSASDGDYPGPYRDAGASDVSQWARAHTSLHDELRSNLCGHALSDRDALLAICLIDALDDDGYLRSPYDELAPDDLQPAPETQEWDIALRLVQQLAAPGIGARTLSECLQLQLDALPVHTPQRALARRLCAQSLELLARRDYAGLMQTLQCSESALRTACQLIQSLDPRPGSRYARIDPSNYITPDIMVRKSGQQWIAVPNQRGMPGARLNTSYAGMLRTSRNDSSPALAQSLREARWLVRSLAQRDSTIQRVAQAIVGRQQTFFEYGDVALRPLMLSEIADELDLHESTVSRAASGKYMATPQGVLEFGHFLSRELSTRAGGTCSASAVRALIKEMILKEDPHAPLSDVDLAARLRQQGIIVARRTVSKYRGQIHYPPAPQRLAP